MMQDFITPLLPTNHSMWCIPSVVTYNIGAEVVSPTPQGAERQQKDVRCLILPTFTPRFYSKLVLCWNSKWWFWWWWWLYQGDDDEEEEDDDDDDDDDDDCSVRWFAHAIFLQLIWDKVLKISKWFEKLLHEPKITEDGKTMNDKDFRARGGIVGGKYHQAAILGIMMGLTEDSRAMLQSHLDIKKWEESDASVSN